jgi:hypothetical protein
MTHKIYPPTPIEEQYWTLTVCDEQNIADIFTMDGDFVAEQWDATEAREYVAQHNAALRLAALGARWMTT